jgi:hypothetical protein
MRFVREDTIDHIASPKNDHGGFVTALRSIAVAKSTKIRRLRDFRRSSIFNFGNNIRPTADSLRGLGAPSSGRGSIASK